jgi:hypothetical protein
VNAFLSRALLTCAFALAACGGGSGSTPPDLEAIGLEVDTYIAQRFDGPADATATLVGKLEAAGLDAGEVEALIRRGRTFGEPPQARGQITEVPIDCYHVDYSSSYYIYVPPTYDPARPHPLVIVGHGGNSAMSSAEAREVARDYLTAYRPALGDSFEAILVAPATTRGWGFQGNSLWISAVYQAKRDYNIDADRVYMVGQSMGGHLSYRSALMLPDHLAAVSPQSGGYDYVADGSIGNLASVPGYVTYGDQDIYDLTAVNRTNGAWLTEHGYPWIIREMHGGHDIYLNQQPHVANFFYEHPRNMYPRQVYHREAGAMLFNYDWATPMGAIDTSRPLRWNNRFWVEMTPRPEHDGPLAYAATIDGNHISIVSDNVRHFRIYLHPEMVDFGQPVGISVNGVEVSNAVPTPDLAMMLELVREFDDRGRIYHAVVDFDVTTDADVPVLSF